VKVTKEIVKGLVGSLLSGSFDDAVASPEFHEEAWDLCCSKYPRVALAAPRAHAKTSGITLGYGIATLLFRERKFMLLVSDTEAQASLFLGLFKQQLLDNPEVIELFGLAKNVNGQVDVEKDTETDVIFKFKDGAKFRIIAKGAEQKLRGLVWEGSRPDIVLCDDMENDELVMNKDRREKMRRWFYSALMPSLATKGVIRVVGTILHMDSLLERLMPENQLLGPKKGHIRHTELKTWTDYSVPWKSIRYRAHNPDFSELLWPERYDRQFFEDKYKDYALQGIPDAYSQEYLNHPIDETNAYFKKGDFIARTLEDNKKTLNFYITADLAITEGERSDWSVFVVAGMDENRIIHVVDVIRERIDARDIVDMVMMLHDKYNPSAIGIEDSQITKSIGPFLNEEMIKRGRFVNLIKLKHGGKDKIARARSIQARLRTHAVKFDTGADWFPGFLEECIQFPRAKHDDQVDAFAYLGLMLLELIEAPTEEEQREEEYQESYERHLEDSPNTNRTTGY